MPINPKGPPQKPGLSIRGRVIFDTVRGVPRARPWPPKKPTKPGTKRNLTAKAFGAANRACKVTASVFYGEHWQATRGTPLLPRDLMIAMMYGRAFALKLEDGRIIRSMASRNDVSKSLDMIGQEPGTVLVRGDHYWEARQSFNVAAQWHYLETRTSGLNFSPGATRGYAIENLATINVKQMAVTVDYTAGQLFETHIAEISPTHEVLSLATSTHVEAPADGIYTLYFNVQKLLHPGNRYAFLATLKNGTASEVVPFSQTDNARLTLPVIQQPRLALASTTVTVGDTLASATDLTRMPHIHINAEII